MFKTIWKFEVADDKVPEFQKAYSATGEWANLFKKASGFVGTELLRADNNSFVTIDSWKSSADFENFKSQFFADYNALNKKCESLTESENHIGNFSS
jgi:heme-degrading monooxygenase HmoA